MEGGLHEPAEPGVQLLSQAAEGSQARFWFWSQGVSGSRRAVRLAREKLRQRIQHGSEKISMKQGSPSPAH